MATFTMNSQKDFVPETAPKSIFDKGFALAVALVVLVGVLWATEWVLTYLADKQIAQYQATTATNLATINADDVEAVHDVTSRLDTIKKENDSAVNPTEILSTLEKTTIPQVKLLEYEYKNDGSVMMRGTVADYRLLAEQILRYRKEEMFASAEVTATDRSESGQITFDITVMPKEAKTSAAEPAPAI